MAPTIRELAQTMTETGRQDPPEDDAAEAEPDRVAGALDRAMAFGFNEAPDAPRPARTQITPSDASPAGDGAAAPKPEWIGPYRILGVLGQGGMGVVFKAERRDPVRQLVAIKVVKQGLATAEVLSRFELERRALAAMNHGCIARVFDAGSTDRGEPYFVMELVEGLPITEYCDRHRLSVNERLRLFQQVCHAVQHAHQKGIVHRDLKPGNVLVTRQGTEAIPKVLDFGLAKATNRDFLDATLCTERDRVMGTPEYMAPEQAAGDSEVIDLRTDVYSLGVMLYRLLTGTLPFPTEELRRAGSLDAFRIIREVDPPRPSARLSTEHDIGAAVADRCRTTAARLAKELRGDLDWIVFAAMAKEPERRYDAAVSLANDIERYLAHEPVLAGPPSARYRLGKLVRRHRRQLAAVAAVVVTAVLGAVFAVDYALEAKAQEDVATRRARQLEEKTEELRRRTDELEQVTEFQASQLRRVDPETMGNGLRRGVVAQARAAMERAGLTDAEVTARCARIDEALIGANFTNLALETLQDNILDHTLATIDEEFDEQPLVRAQLLEASALTLRSLGLVAEAVEPQRRAVSIRRDRLGADHPDTLWSINRLGSLLADQGKMTEAIRCYREATEGCRRVLGDDHRRTLTSLHNLGSALCELGRREEARPYLDEALERNRRLFGDDAPDTLACIATMGSLLTREGNYTAAERHFREVLDARRRRLGNDDPDTLAAMNSLGWMLWTSRRLADAEPLFREALAGRRRTLGDDHPDTLTSLNNLASLFAEQGEAAAAVRHYGDALEASGRVLGRDHPRTLMLHNNLGSVLTEQGKLSEAERHYRTALDGLRRVHGAEHPTTLGIEHNLGTTLTRLDRFAAAEPCLRHVLDADRRTLGADHAQTLVTAAWLGRALLGRGQAELQAGSYATAEPALLEAHGLLLKSKGRDHEDTQRCGRNIVTLYDALHAADPAAGHDAKAAAWRRKIE